MRILLPLAAAGAMVAGAAFLVLVPSWTGVPKAATQVAFPQSIQFQPQAVDWAINQVPKPLPAAESGGPAATAVYKNVQVLTDVSAAEFMRTQQAITNWVAPKEGCAFCHNGQDYASDDNPHKQVARTMLAMVRHMNADWQPHVAPAGVTCYSCHRGLPLPVDTWYPQTPPPIHPLIAQAENWNEAASTVRGFFPDAGWAEYYLQDEPIHAQSLTALPTNRIGSFDEVKRIYEMMMQQSDGLGVNCGYCHNSRAFWDWNQSTPYRWNGWSGIRMVRDLNKNFLLKAAEEAPQTRQLAHQNVIPAIPARETGTQDGNGLVVCKTCHEGLPRPLNGANMVNDYPALIPAAARNKQ